MMLDIKNLKNKYEHSFFNTKKLNFIEALQSAQHLSVMMAKRELETRSICF